MKGFLMNKKLIMMIAAALSVLLVLFIFKGFISKQIYMMQVNELADKVPAPADDRINYKEDLRYTMNKLWSSRQEKIITQNDLNEVLDRLKALNRKENVTEKEIFDFIDYVSNIYTTAIIKRNNESSSSGETVIFSD